MCRWRLADSSTTTPIRPSSLYSPIVSVSGKSSLLSSVQGSNGVLLGLALGTSVSLLLSYTIFILYEYISYIKYSSNNPNVYHKLSTWPWLIYCFFNVNDLWLLMIVPLLQIPMCSTSFQISHLTLLGGLVVGIWLSQTPHFTKGHWSFKSL